MKTVVPCKQLKQTYLYTTLQSSQLAKQETDWKSIDTFKR